MTQYRNAFGLALAGAALVGLSALLARYNRDLRAARERMAGLGSRMLDTANGPVEYAVRGQGYPVLVVHGAMGGFDQGLFLSHNIDIPNIQIISISRFGYLRTPVPPDATLDSQADSFAAVLDALGIQRAAIFAVSAGTTSAIRFAARHPGRVSALVLLSPDAPGDMYMKMPPRFVFDKLMRSDFFYWVMITFFKEKVATVMSLIPAGHIPTPEDRLLMNRVITGDFPTSPRMDGTVFETYDLWDALMASVTPASPYPLRQIETPTLVINAANDPISIPENVRALANQMPNARLYLVPDGGHLLFGHSKDVNAEIASFLCTHVPELQQTSAGQDASEPG